MTLLGAIALFAGTATGDSAPQERASRLPYEGSETILGSILQIDVGLILATWKIKGVMVCMNDGAPRACLVIENAYPCGLLEVVRQAGRSHLAEMSVLKALEAFADFGALYGKSSSHTAQSDQGSQLQFAEAHVYTFVPPLLAAPGLDAIPIVRPIGPLFQVSYFSEIDGFSWRTAFADYAVDPAGAARHLGLPSCESVPRTDDCAWKWGSWSPRIGFLNHPSEVMAAYMQALRAGRAASTPTGRVVLSGYPFEPRTGHWIEMLHPVRRPCVPIGWPSTRLLETDALSNVGAYYFMHYGIFEECKGCLPATLVGPRVPIW